ncbi:GFA family protein (plasmid) [Novosphingobium sp. EMRT-2]|nr:GFA family protein [Novosphingobium sp. EMRT-2]QCI96260.1 GFA family protein [Novosphingobium sp. EMRT-2]
MDGSEHQELEGGCLCGAMRYVLHAPPRVHYCHCSMCRRSTGSAFAILAWVRWDDVGWIGDTQISYRSSPIAVRSFCGDCGSPLTIHYDEASGVATEEVAFHVGTLDHPGRVTPAYHYGVEGRLPWADCGAGLPERETEESWDA